MKMRREISISVALAAVFGCLLAWMWLTPKAVPPREAASPTPAPKDGASSGPSPPPKPSQMIHFNHKPSTAKEKATWDWWFYMDEHDPDFQWKTPIEFYGQVVDQHYAPVANARVSLQWSGLGETPEKNLFSDTEGKFSLNGARGKGLSVSVGKNGYLGDPRSTTRSFEYSAFYEPHFHTPDKNNPVIFRLWKLDAAEPMFFWRKGKDLSVNGEQVWFDTKTGNFGTSGDVAFSTTRGTTYKPRQFDWAMTIEAAPGGGIALREEALMFEAPDGGYQQSWTMEIDGRQDIHSFQISKKVKFYLKTPEGKYAAMEADFTQMGVPEAEVILSAYFNPSGSRNLQYDAKQRIERK